MTARRILKTLTQTLIPSRLPPVIIASMGRSGSTLVYDAVRTAFAQQRFPDFTFKYGIRIVSDEAWNLAEKRYLPGVVYKTHALADELPAQANAKIVFLFGSASEAALSVFACQKRFGDDWISAHFEHLRAKAGFSELGSSDILRFEEQVDGWIARSGIDRLILRYDTVWDHHETLSDFVGARVALPTRLRRVGSGEANADTIDQFKKTYARIDSKIAALPDCQVLR